MPLHSVAAIDWVLYDMLVNGGDFLRIFLYLLGQVGGGWVREVNLSQRRGKSQLVFVSGRQRTEVPKSQLVRKSWSRESGWRRTDGPLGFWRSTLKVVEVSMTSREWPQELERCWGDMGTVYSVIFCCVWSTWKYSNLSLREHFLFLTPLDRGCCWTCWLEVRCT